MSALSHGASFAPDLMDMGDVIRDAGLSPMRAAFQEALLYSPGRRIGGGRDEILKDIIAERVLGLPADIRVDKETAFRTSRRVGRPRRSREVRGRAPPRPDRCCRPDAPDGAEWSAVRTLAQPRCLPRRPV
jgi:hypothetical protein